MADAALTLLSAAALGAVGLLALALRPARRANAWLAGLLLLQGATTAAYATLSAASEPSQAQLGARLTIWASLLLPIATVRLAQLLAPERRRGDRHVLAALGALTLAGLLAQALRPSWYVKRVVEGPLGYAMESASLLYLLAGAVVLAQAYAALRLAAAADDGSGARGRRALLAALAFSLLPIYSAAFFATFLFTTATPLAPEFLVRVGLTFLAAGLAAAALRRALRTVSRQARGVSLALLGALALLGMLDGLVAGAPALARFVPGYERSVGLLRVALALLLALAALRYGTADVAASERAHVKRAMRVAVRLAVAGAAAGVVLLVAGAGALSLALVAAIVLGGSLLQLPVTTRPADALTRALLLPADDPRAVSERARTYASAVAASQGAGPEGERYLAALREDLGITAQEHELLVQGVASREAPRYRSVETLGRGATAQVDVALDGAGRRVVVKRFTGLRDPAAALREARALAAVRHPRVVTLHEVDRRGEELYLVLAHAEGGSARQLLDREGPLPPERAVALAADLLEGLEALHAAGIVHCDVKPENLLLDAEGRGLLGDFGSARFAAPDALDATLAGSGGEGSLSTMSPEALRGAPPSPARDVYAAGALLYRLLTGEHYVEMRDASAFEARERITMDPPRLPHPRVPAAIEPVLRKALAKRAEERYASAREMRDALTAAARAPA